MVLRGFLQGLIAFLDPPLQTPPPKSRSKLSRWPAGAAETHSGPIFFFKADFLSLRLFGFLCVSVCFFFLLRSLFCPEWLLVCVGTHASSLHPGVQRTHSTNGSEGSRLELSSFQALQRFSRPGLSSLEQELSAPHDRPQGPN